MASGLIGFEGSQWGRLMGLSSRRWRVSLRARPWSEGKTPRAILPNQTSTWLRREDPGIADESARGALDDSGNYGGNGRLPPEQIFPRRTFVAIDAGVPPKISRDRFAHRGRFGPGISFNFDQHSV